MAARKSSFSLAQLVAYAILICSVTIPLIFHHVEWLPNAQTVASFIQHIQSYDLGNVIAVLLGVGGYLLEHWFSRQSSQLERQMERVEQQSHQLLVPVTMQWHVLWSVSTLNFIDKHIGDIMKREEYKDDMNRYQEKIRVGLAKNPVMELPTKVNPISLIMWLEVMYDSVESGEKKGKVERWTITSKHELPLILHNEIQKCDRGSKLWKSYETFIRHSFVPTVEKIANIIDENGHLMEPVSSARMKEIFGADSNGYGQKWTIMPRMWFYSFFVAYYKSWLELISLWDNGVYEEIRPAVDFPVGIMAFNVEAQSIVAEVEQRLIGMSQMHGHGRS